MGPVTFFQLISRFKTARAALDALPGLTAGRAKHSIPPREEIISEYEAALGMGAQLVCAIDPAYPLLLRELTPPPPILTMLGNAALAHTRCVAMVGARQASAAGRKLAREIAADLSKEGVVIVSGMARGIDGEAHAAALHGGTIAVLGGGIDHIYPPQHERLYHAISEHGLLVSEAAFGHRATARDFPRRNRIVTGISEGVILIEAAERSGSLISARTALEQNREVFAVPGSPLDPRYAGTNRLLRDGAILVRNAEDVMDALSKPVPPTIRAPIPPEYGFEFNPDDEIPDTQRDAVRSALTMTPILIEEIARTAGISPHRCSVILVDLELSGLAVTYSGGLASLAVE